MSSDRPAGQSTVRNLDSPRQLVEWANTLVARHRRRLADAGPTPPSRHRPGTASSCLDDHSVSWVLDTWDDLSAAFAGLQRKNLLVDGADPAVLATAFMAALQGGYLLSVTARHIAPLEVAVDMALQQVARSLAGDPPPAHDRDAR